MARPDLARAALLPLALALSLAAATAAPARADRDRHGPGAGPGPLVAVPAVEGIPVEEAVRRLERAGLLPTVVEVADLPEEHVGAQVPAAGVRVPAGSTVELRVGVAVRIETRVPDVRGWPADRAARALAGAYVVEVEEVVADRAREGTVLATVPAAGARLPFRGTLLLQVAVAPVLVVLPRVHGLALQDAERRLAAAGLAAVPSFVPAWGVPPWAVLTQSPAAGARVEAGTVVQLGVARPRRLESVRVPALVGLGEADALRVLAALGLAGQVERVVGRVQVGRVLAQDPAPDARLAAGGTVRLTVAARGFGPLLPRTVPVPDVVGLDAVAARSALALAGFRVVQRTEDAPERPLGVVVAQEPAAGVAAPEGSRVALATPTPTEVPDLRGKGVAEARALLAAAGLLGSFEAARPDPRAVVAVQHPAAGTPVARGSAVRATLGVNVGVRTAPLPSVVGLTAAQAQDVLAGFGLAVVLDGPRTAPHLLRVVAQDPVAGTPVTAGSEVRLRVVAPGGPRR